MSALCWPNCSTAWREDINQDGLLNNVDIDIFIANWRRDTSGLTNFNQWLAGDLTQNGVVDLSDWYELWVAFNAAGLSVPPPGEFAAVPEPTSIAVALFCAALLIPANRHKTDS